MGVLMFRLVLTTINIFFPPLSVAILCGLEWDCILNCCLFLLAVIPSHIHGFYISRTYFHRRHKVKKGRYPGGQKSFIYSQKVINGGATDAEVARLYRKEYGMERKRSSSRHGSVRQNDSGQRPQMLQNHNSHDTSAMLPAQSSHMTGRGRHHPAAIQTSDPYRRPGLQRLPSDEHTARDGYSIPPWPEAGTHHIGQPQTLAW